MEFFEILRISLKALMINKSRALLTALGIIIGVGSVIAMVSIGEGAKKDWLANIEASGANVIMIFSENTSAGNSNQRKEPRGFSIEDSNAIQEYCKHIEYASPSIRSTARVIYKKNNWSTAINGGNEGYFFIRDWKLESGRFFSPAEVKNRAKVAVIGSIVKDELFDGDDPVGKVIRVNRIPMKVVGVMKGKGQSGHGGNTDDQIIIPYTTAMQHFYRKPYFTMLITSATSREDTDKAIDEITLLMRQRHQIRAGEDDDFSVHSQKERLESANESSQIFTTLLAAIASVSLLVGGIGIMNIMLVSVTERVREIGIRLAIGARQRDILYQFLTEAIILSVTGGLIGVLLGVVTSFIITKVAKWPTLISMPAILVSLGFSCAIGIFFGFYPAFKASRLNPIESLRKE